MYYLNEITQLEELINKVSVERSELIKSNNLKVQDVFNRYFNYFKEFNIQVSGDSAYFRVKDQDETFKEIFTIYFHERYKEDSKLELSYYTTSTHSDFEIERLISLGKVARILRDNQEEILQYIKVIKRSDLERSNELYRIQDGYEKEKRSYQNANNERRKSEIELSLKGEGVTFDKDVYIELKRNYTVRVISMKIITVSKSNKTCIVQFGTVNRLDGSVWKLVEERVDVQSLISQIVSHSKNIV
jgi:hypothetical protein